MATRGQRGATENSAYQPDLASSLTGSELSGSGVGVDAAYLASSRASDKNGAASALECVIQGGLVHGPIPNTRPGEALTVPVPWVRDTGLTPDIAGTASQWSQSWECRETPLNQMRRNVASKKVRVLRWI